MHGGKGREEAVTPVVGSSAVVWVVPVGPGSAGACCCEKRSAGSGCCTGAELCPMAAVG